MYEVDKEGIFTALEELKNWKYTPAEQDIIFDKMPDRIQYTEFKNKILLDCGKARPTSKTLINLAWEVVKDRKKAKNRIIYEGCQNCEAGYIKIPNVKAFDEIVLDPWNLMALQFYPTINIPCNCTGIKPNITTFLEDLQNYQTTNPTLYEIFYLMLYGYMNMWFTGNRFDRLDKFNPYLVWNVAHDHSCVLKVDDLRFKHLFGHEVKITKPALKKVVNNITETYQHKIYEGE